MAGGSRVKTTTVTYKCDRCKKIIDHTGYSERNDIRPSAVISHMDFGAWAWNSGDAIPIDTNQTFELCYACTVLLAEWLTGKPVPKELPKHEWDSNTGGPRVKKLNGKVVMEARPDLR